MFYRGCVLLTLVVVAMVMTAMQKFARAAADLSTP